MSCAYVRVFCQLFFHDVPASLTEPIRLNEWVYERILCMIQPSNETPSSPVTTILGASQCVRMCVCLWVCCERLTRATTEWMYIYVFMSCSYIHFCILFILILCINYHLFLIYYTRHIYFIRLPLITSFIVYCLFLLFFYITLESFTCNFPIQFEPLSPYFIPLPRKAKPLALPASAVFGRLETTLSPCSPWLAIVVLGIEHIHKNLHSADWV